MTKEFKAELMLCKSFNEMLDVLKNYYSVNKEVGAITKGVIIAGLNIEMTLEKKVIDNLKNSKTVGEMIAFISMEKYSSSVIASNNKPKLINALSSIITMTQLLKKQ